jgi:hypothetical protein
MTRRQLTALIVSLTAALALATSASAAGEPKNTAPFTRSAPSAASAQPLAAEPKNVAPFNRVVGRTSVAPDWFERYAAAHPYGRDVIASSPLSDTEAATFRWRDALIGAAASAGLLLLVTSIFLVISRKHRVLPTVLEA